MNRPTRRSRKIGRTQGGRVRGGVANEKESREFPISVWEELSATDGPRRHFVENPSRDYFHPASIDECEHVLSLLPNELTTGVRAILLRRPRRRDLARGVEAWKRYGVVALVAVPRNMTTVWPYRVDDGQRRHYAPWCNRWSLGEHETVLQWELEELKRYHLYHLLLHEVGHAVDPKYRRRDKSEAFAEDFALTWARRLGVLE